MSLSIRVRAAREFIISVLSRHPVTLLPPGAGPIMAFKLSVLLLLMAVATVAVLAQRRRPTSTTTDEWNYRDGCEHPAYSLFTLGPRGSSGLIMMMSKLEVKDHTATSMLRPNLFKFLFVVSEALWIAEVCYLL